MAHVTDLLDRLAALKSDRDPWEAHWIDSARYTLPDAERFDRMFASGSAGRAAAIDSVVSEPIAARRGREIYDMTSLWAVDRGASGMLSLATPQMGVWHDLATDDPFGGEASDEETRWYEQLRDYLFNTRANPRSGFWTMQKSSMRCLWAMGMAVNYIEESSRGVSSPISYRYVPLSENHLASNFEGVVDTNFRLFSRSAAQCVERWGTGLSAKTQAKAADPKRKDQGVTILHAVYPRNEGGRTYRGDEDSKRFAWASCYVEVEEKHLIGESGFREFPYRVDHWSRTGSGPYSEGPVALALAEVKSLNMLAKQELRAHQQWVNPPYATLDDAMGRLNLNSGAPNPGYVNQQGQLLIQPIVTMQRPDLARAVIDARREAVKETLYANLWQILIENPGMTATEAMIRANEKGELLGPVGSSLQTGLSFQVDREVAILERRGAFRPGSPLAPPDSLAGRDIGVRFTSPLDKMRRLPQLQGMQQLAAMVGQIAAAKPDALDKIDWDALIDEVQDILGVPRKVMTADDVLGQIRQGRRAQENAMAAAQGTQAAGDAAQSAAAGADAVANSPVAREVVKRLGAGMRAAA